VADVGRNVSFKGDVHRAGDVHLPFHRQADVRGDHGTGAISTDPAQGYYLASTSNSVYAG
jgi:hypothetical protein